MLPLGVSTKSKTAQKHFVLPLNIFGPAFWAGPLGRDFFGPAFWAGPLGRFFLGRLFGPDFWAVFFWAGVLGRLFGGLSGPAFWAKIFWLGFLGRLFGQALCGPNILLGTRPRCSILEPLLALSKQQQLRKQTPAKAAQLNLSRTRCAAWRTNVITTASPLTHRVTDADYPIPKSCRSLALLGCETFFSSRQTSFFLFFIFGPVRFWDLGGSANDAFIEW